MAVHLDEHKVTFFTVPKCAGTSLKELFFEVENGYPFRPIKANGQPIRVHRFYPARSFKEESRRAGAENWKATIIRDPISRILSCYGNRVVHLRVLHDHAFTAMERARGLSPDPDLSNFIRHLERYQKISQPVLHHTRPLNWFLGNDPDYFDRIYTLAETEEMMSDLGERIDPLPKLQRLMTEGPKFTADDLTAEEKRKIETMYAEDYRLFGKVIH